MGNFLKNNDNLQLCYWEDIRKEVNKVNPELAKIIDNISPDKNYPLFQAQYPYGVEILHKGVVRFPDKKSNLVAITNQSIPNKIRDLLGYNLFTNPVSLILKNSVEIFFPLHERTIPLYGIIPEGTIVSTWRILSELPHAPAFLWNMTAGARTLMMLPKISNKERHKQLKSFLNSDIDIPHSLSDQWKIFKAIAQKSHTTWQTKLLFFSEPWFKSLHDKKWSELHRYLLNIGWQKSEYLRNKSCWDIIFSSIKDRNRLKPDPYIDDITRHLIGIGIKAIPALKPCTSDSDAPVKIIQDIYREIYNLRDYDPILMQSGVYDEKKPIYYSIKYPMTLNFSPKANKLTTTLEDLESIQYLLEKYITALTNDDLNIHNTPIYDSALNLEYSFFHPHYKNTNNIQDTKQIPLEDDRFLANSNNSKFPYRCELLHGLIKIE